MEQKSSRALGLARSVVIGLLSLTGVIGCGGDSAPGTSPLVDASTPQDSGSHAQDDASTIGNGDGDDDPSVVDDDASTGDGDGDGDDASVVDDDASTGDGDGDDDDASVVDDDASTGDGDGDNAPGDGDGDGDLSPVFLFAATGYDDAFAEVSELVAVDLVTNSLLWTFSPNDMGADVRESAGRAFLLGQNKDILHIVSPRTGVVANLDLRVEAGTPVGLTDIVVVPGSDVAFLSLAQANQIAVVDLGSNTVTQRIELVDFVDPSDGDKSAEPRRGFYSQTSGLVYFLLNRHDYTAGFGECPSFKNLLIAIDPETLTIADINGAEDGTAITLNLLNSYFISPVNAENEVTLMAGGCYSMSTYQYAFGGLETVSLATGVTNTLYTSPGDDPLQGFLVMGPELALVNRTHPGTFMPTLWNRWNFASPSLGVALLGIPRVPARESEDSVVGVALNEGGTAYQVQRRILSTETTEVLLELTSEQLPTPRSSAVAF